MSLLIFLIVGAIAGWLAHLIMKGGDSDLLTNLVVGIVGAMIGGHLLGILGVSTYGLIGSILSATFGSIVLIAVIRFFRRV